MKQSTIRYKSYKLQVLRNLQKKTRKQKKKEEEIKEEEGRGRGKEAAVGTIYNLLQVPRNLRVL